MTAYLAAPNWTAPHLSGAHMEYAAFSGTGHDAERVTCERQSQLVARSGH